MKGRNVPKFAVVAFVAALVLFFGGVLMGVEIIRQFEEFLRLYGHRDDLMTAFRNTAFLSMISGSMWFPASEY